MRKFAFLILASFALSAFAEYIVWVKDGGVIVQHSANLTITDTDLQGDGWRMGGVVWSNVGVGTSASYTTNNANTNELADIAVIDVEGQIAAKTNMLFQVEGIYKTFLTNEWTTCLRTAGIISNTVTIDWTNTSTTANMTYLMTLRAMDVAPLKPTYSYYKNEFESFRINIERLGGSMSNIK